jgi:ribosomal protein S18 acetylase RimI-like enzyme
MFVFRKGEAKDVETLVEFNCRLAQETESRCLDAETVRRGVLRGLMLAPEVRYFVAEGNGRVIGQLMLTREWSDWRDGWMIWLQSVYVQAEFRGTGVFRRLLEYAIQDVSAAESAVNSRLYVEHDNMAAKAVYQKLGFVSAGYEVMERPMPPTEPTTAALTKDGD